MSEETPVSNTHGVSDPHSVLPCAVTKPNTPAANNSLCNATLPPYDIERICKAFIRLILATERGVKNDVK